eukprot:11253813-Ditylum_brightwellii.AAC.1
MVKKGLNIHNRGDIKSVTVDDYKECIALLEHEKDDTSEYMNKKIATLSLTCHDGFNFHVDSIPWNPQTTPPMNDIAMAYVTAVSLYKTEYKKTTDSATHNTEATSTVADLKVLLDDAESEEEVEWTDDINPSEFGNTVRS